MANRRPRSQTRPDHSRAVQSSVRCDSSYSTIVLRDLPACPAQPFPARPYCPLPSTWTPGVCSRRSLSSESFAPCQDVSPHLGPYRPVLGARTPCVQDQDPVEDPVKKSTTAKLPLATCLRRSWTPPGCTEGESPPGTPPAFLEGLCTPARPPPAPTPCSA